MAILDRYRTSPGRRASVESDLLDIELIDPTLVVSDDPEPDPPAIELDRVSVFFGQFCALDEVSLTIEPGEVVGIIGPSGSGKSTLVRTVNQLLRQSLGQVRLFGVEATGDRYDLQRLRRMVGMVFQDFNLFPHLSVLTNVTVALRLVRSVSADEADDLAMAALDRVSMSRHAAKRPDQLSGGEQQRVAIARAIAPEPRILLLDEPTASIDPELTKGVMQIVADIAATDVTVVTVTHEMGFVARVADRVAVLHGGRIVELGPPDTVLRAPSNERTRQFLADVRFLAAS